MRRSRDAAALALLVAALGCLPRPHFGVTQSRPYRGLVADECVRAAIFLAVDVDGGGVKVSRAGFGREFDYLIQYRAGVGGLPGVLVVDQRVESDTTGLLLATFLVARPDSVKIDAGRHRRAVDDVLNTIWSACALVAPLDRGAGPADERDPLEG